MEIDLSKETQEKNRKRQFSQVMMQRWREQVAKELPEVDQQDLSSFSSGSQSQFNPEFSQEAYIAMRKAEE